MDKEYYGTGKRKTAIARVWIRPGKGNITINKKTLSEYFGTYSDEATVKTPMILTNSLENYDIIATVKGGGHAGQAGAVRHGISKVLLELNNNLRPTLKKAGYITRDSRIKERKKYGRKGARKSFQFSKR